MGVRLMAESKTGTVDRNMRMKKKVELVSQLETENKISGEDERADLAD